MDMAACKADRFLQWNMPADPLAHCSDTSAEDQAVLMYLDLFPDVQASDTFSFGVLLWLMHTGEHRCFCINRLLMQQMLSACWACLTCRRAAMAGRDCNRDSKPGFGWGG